MPNYAATALVVHRINLAENDRILTLFTREHGKLSAVAKGARRTGSRLSGATELFIQARLYLATGRSLDIITQCEIQNAFPGLRADLQRLTRATYFCELLDRTTAERDALSSAELYDLTSAALALLQRAEEYPDAVVHAYELHLLGALGYAPILDRCVVCGEPVAQRVVWFSPMLGGVLCPTDRNHGGDSVPLSQASLGLLRQMQTGAEEDLLAMRPDSKTAAEIAKALRWYIRFRTERSLKSADFLDQLRGSA